MTSTRRAVFLDRDGVLNEAPVEQGRPTSPGRPEDLRIVPTAPAACQKLREDGYVLIVVTNQPDVARGTLTAEAVEATNARLRSAVQVDAVYWCPHDDADRCECRKPAPGMLVTAAEQFGVDLSRSFMVGDRWRDVEAGKAAGCTAIHIARGYDERPPEGASATVADIGEAAEWILSHPLTSEDLA